MAKTQAELDLDAAKARIRTLETQLQSATEKSIDLEALFASHPVLHVELVPDDLPPGAKEGTVAQISRGFSMRQEISKPGADSDDAPIVVEPGSVVYMERIGFTNDLGYSQASMLSRAVGVAQRAFSDQRVGPHAVTGQPMFGNFPPFKQTRGLYVAVWVQ